MKRLFREVIRPLVPAAVLDRPKRGFGVPLRRWFHEQMLGWARDIMLDPRSRQRGWTRAGEVSALLRQHETGARDHAKRIWALVCLELWARAHVDQRRPARGATSATRDAVFLFANQLVKSSCRIWGSAAVGSRLHKPGARAPPGRRLMRTITYKTMSCAGWHGECMYKNAPASAHKGKPTERWGRKTSGLTARAYDSGVAGIAHQAAISSTDDAAASSGNPHSARECPPRGSPPDFGFSRRCRGFR